MTSHSSLLWVPVTVSCACPFTVGTIMAPKDVAILISRTCEYVRLYDKARIKAAGGIKMADHLTFK